MVSLKLVLLPFALIFIAKGHGQFLLESPRVTNWGDWGEVEHCPPMHFIYGLRAKIQSPGGIFTDDTALNGIELLCASPMRRLNATQNKSFASITSLVGHKGAWTVIQECPMPTFAVGFQLRSEENQLVADDSAGNDIRLMCSTGDNVGAFGVTNFGDWTTPQPCPRGLALCGVQTQVEGSGHTDETSLNNVNMYCCDASTIL